MPEFALPPETNTGAVSLTVTDLERSLVFYQNVLGLQLHYQEGSCAILGVGETNLLILNGNAKAQAPSRTTGLYHFAIRVPNRRDLAHVLHRIAETQTPVTGFADHSVSEAIYLPDPDGNGIEIYRDRPRSTWFSPDGALIMGTDPLDIESLLAETSSRGQTWAGLPEGTIMGHIHLHVADLNEAIQFYRDVLGFDLMMRYGPSAAFLSAGGYHHHIGINTWNGVGALPPPKGATGMDYYTLQLPDIASKDLLESHLAKNSIPYQKNGHELWLRDPSANRIRIIETHN